MPTQIPPDWRRSRRYACRSRPLTGYDCRTVDISAQGLGIETLQWLEPGSEIEIEVKGKPIAFEVRHCRDGGDGLFRAGLLAKDLDADLMTFFL